MTGFADLSVGGEYTFVFGDGVPAIKGVLVEICEVLVIDGTSSVGGEGRRYYVNPDRVIYAREEPA